MKLEIAGGGIIAREVVPQLRSWGWEPVALCSTPSGEAALKELAAANNVPETYTDFDAMLAQADADTCYIAVPNYLHFEFARRALAAGKNVIVEKPMTSNVQEARALAALAREKGLYLYEAITTVYLPNFLRLQQLLPQIGTVKMVYCNFSQYSRRYDAFRAGTVLPVFDPKKSGGALMDLNLYNIYWTLGLFGAPDGLTYHANVERGIDTSGVLLLDYPGFRAAAIAAKDCAAPCCTLIQGTEGYLMQSTPASICGEILLHRNDGSEVRFQENPPSRLEPEFRLFARQIAARDPSLCEAALERSILVSEIQTRARLEAGVRFPADGTEA